MIRTTTVTPCVVADHTLRWLTAHGFLLAPSLRGG